MFSKPLNFNFINLILISESSVVVSAAKSWKVKYVLQNSTVTYTVPPFFRLGWGKTLSYRLRSSVIDILHCSYAVN